MTERRWPLVVAAVVAAVVIAGAAWAAGRASAPDTPAAGDEAPTGGSAAVRTIDGVPVGVQQSRAGALAAADNYVAAVSENVVKDPRLYETLVRRVFAPNEQDYALREGERARTLAPAAVSDYAEGGGAVALIGARRLDTYDGSRAQVTTWLGGVVWGPSRRPTQRWQLVETDLRWDGQRWLVERMRPAERSAPAPAVTKADDTSAYDRATFERELRGMTAPTYGVR
ncbi:MAG: hypothetical protein ACRDPC_19580 [Solirubrobacteraceae bacterium]